jgi:glycosyltransferase involved in cell wall biosynthesis
MVARGHDVTVLTTDVASRRGRFDELREDVRGARVVRVRNVSQRLVAANLFTPRHFRSRLAELLPRADFVHVHDVFNWLTVSTARAVAATRTPSVLSTDGLFSFDRNRGRARTRALLFRLMGRRVLSRVDIIHAVRAEELDHVALGISTQRLRYIANGVPYPPRAGDGARFRQRWSLANRTVVLFVGQLLPMKGIGLLRELAEEKRSETDLCFVFAGHRPDGTDVAPGWAGPNVLHVGFLSGQDLADAYAAASLYTLPSYFDVMPNTALDALAYGVPSLVTRQILLPEIAEAGAGLLIDPNLDSLRAGLDQLLSQRAAWPRMAAAARKLVAERFALNRIHDRYEAMYRELVQR